MGSPQIMRRGPSYLGNPHDHPIWEELSDALDAAMTQHPTMNSPHEGKSVIEEELDELWEHVRGICDDRCNGRSPNARKEAIQIAAMGIRYALDLCSYPLAATPPTDNTPASPLPDADAAEWHDTPGTPAADPRRS